MDGLLSVSQCVQMSATFCFFIWSCLVHMFLLKITIVTVTGSPSSVYCYKIYVCHKMRGICVNEFPATYTTMCRLQENVIIFWFHIFVTRRKGHLDREVNASGFSKSLQEYDEVRPVCTLFCQYVCLPLLFWVYAQVCVQGRGGGRWGGVCKCLLDSCHFDRKVRTFILFLCWFVHFFFIIL